MKRSPFGEGQIIGVLREQEGGQSSWLFGAVCPDLGTGAALVLPVCNTEAMQLHLDVIADSTLLSHRR
jgi:hypothetical protein